MGENKASYLTKSYVDKIPASDQKDVKELKTGVGNAAGGALQNPLGGFVSLLQLQWCCTLANYVTTRLATPPTILPNLSLVVEHFYDVLKSFEGSREEHFRASRGSHNVGHVCGSLLTFISHP